MYMKCVVESTDLPVIAGYKGTWLKSDIPCIWSVFCLACVNVLQNDSVTGENFKDSVHL